MDKEQERFLSRIRELAKRAEERYCYTYSDFLNLSEQSMVLQFQRELQGAGMTFYGGSPYAERKIVCFGNEENCGYPIVPPIAFVEIAPVNLKFAEPLAHRDVLGSLMHQGIVREKLGDIFAAEQKAYAVVSDTLADYLIEEVTRIKHTQVTCKLVEALPEICRPKTEMRMITAASNRLDAVMSGVYHLSREESRQLLSAGKVLLDGMETASGTKALKAGEVVSVRGCGRFRFLSEEGLTGKGRQRIRIEIWV